ncbi:uncharacterized protein LOC132202878 isoform X2 [Neocloeon triangulifer]|uniref:uncharacterized protein LOC132202878 isoform X2 n=1 Tax=Neocloeon triangulifer TaxID=2078957 RepID=UPI00286EF136|nr:uncharacterized protein LOC132202878 isoform X2 [Neocloeon triangulifer]
MQNREVEFVWRLSQSLDPRAAGHGLLVAHLLKRCKRLEEIGSLNLPSGAVRPAVKCQFCFNSWNEQLFRVRVKKKSKLKTKSKKVLKRHEADPLQLRPVEKNLVPKLKKNCPALILTCPMCQKTSEFQLPKKVAPPPETPEPQSLKKKRKKSKKDKLCGLRMSLNSSDLSCHSPLLSSAASSPCASPIPVKSPMTSTPKSALTKLKVSPAVVANSLKKDKLKKQVVNKDLLKKMMLNQSRKNTLGDFLKSIP